MQWESEGKTKAQLLQPLEHLRACDIVRKFAGQPAPMPAIFAS